LIGQAPHSITKSVGPRFLRNRNKRRSTAQKVPVTCDANVILYIVSQGIPWFSIRKTLSGVANTAFVGSLLTYRQDRFSTPIGWKAGLMPRWPLNERLILRPQDCYNPVFLFPRGSVTHSGQFVVVRTMNKTLIIYSFSTHEAVIRLIGVALSMP
jgi:hypothetical protein